MYVFQLFDYYSASRIVLVVAFFECIVVAYIYGMFPSRSPSTLNYIFSPFFSFNFFCATINIFGSRNERSKLWFLLSSGGISNIGGNYYFLSLKSKLPLSPAAYPFGIVTHFAKKEMDICIVQRTPWSVWPPLRQTYVCINSICIMDSVLLLLYYGNGSIFIGPVH